jgi:hypothetical protein
MPAVRATRTPGRVVRLEGAGRMSISVGALTSAACASGSATR